MTDCLCTGTPPCWICQTCPDHPTIPRADCVCPYPGEDPC